MRNLLIFRPAKTKFLKALDNFHIAATLLFISLLPFAWWLVAASLARGHLRTNLAGTPGKLLVQDSDWASIMHTYYDDVGLCVSYLI